MSRYLHLARARGIASPSPLRGPSLVSGKDRHKSLSARAAAELLRYDWAHPEPAIDQDEFFDDQFERRAREIQRTPSGQSSVSIVPQKSGPWSGNNQLGIERPFNPDENGFQTILRLDEWGFPEVWSVMLGVRYSDDAWGASPSAAFDITALVEAGCGGAIQRFEVDWSQGTTFSCNMNALNVVASFRASPSTPSDLRLVATLARKKLTERPPTRTLTMDANAGTSEVIRIPDFARSVTMVDRSASIANTVYQAGVEFEFLANPNATNGNTRVWGDQLASFNPQGVPIPAFARYMSMTSAPVLGPVAVSAVFSLGL